MKHSFVLVMSKMLQMSYFQPLTDLPAACIHAVQRVQPLKTKYIKYSGSEILMCRHNNCLLVRMLSIITLKGHTTRRPLDFCEMG
jgi:hypothetical protein